MQTFLLFIGKNGIILTAKKLDNRRLNAQIGEAAMTLRQIRHLKGTLAKGVKIFNAKHPCGIQWLNYEKALQFYYNTMIDEWERRGKSTSYPKETLENEEDIVFPPFVTDESYIETHRRNMIRKDPEYYNEWKDLGKESGYKWYFEEDGNPKYRYIAIKEQSTKKRKRN